KCHQRGFPMVSDVLRSAVRSSGQSLHALARATGIDPSCLSRFVRNERTITLPLADRLASVLGLELRRADGSPIAPPERRRTPTRRKAPKKTATRGRGK